MFKNLSSQAALALALATAPVAVLAAPWATEPAQAASQAGRSSYDGVVEALRQTVVAAQVPGAVVELAVKAGDTVQAGQLLLRIDARSADQSAAAVDAQVQAARAQLDVATREYERQKQLFAKKYISQAALDRAEAEVRAARAQASAQTAQAGARADLLAAVNQAYLVGRGSSVTANLAEQVRTALFGRSITPPLD
ncbi:MAG TPA: biotin/lipoyl-binding protein, partial [Giesbergeria sp.]|nr:biotin/lipoyl-binding protein [Giesbergeria sp.]